MGTTQPFCGSHCLSASGKQAAARALTAMGLGAEAAPSPDSHMRGADDNASYSWGPREEPGGWVHVHPVGRPLLAAQSP